MKRSMTATSWQSDGLVLQSGSGRFTRNVVFWPASATVKKSLGNGDCCIADTLNRGATDGVGGGGGEPLVPQPTSRRAVPTERRAFALARRSMDLIAIGAQWDSPTTDFQRSGICLWAYGVGPEIQERLM